jgi:DNA-binding MarR family transcriptional regulator
MTQANDPLSTLDEALLRLRRFTQAPPADRAPGPSESAEMSTVLVVDAVEQLAASGEPAIIGGIAIRLSVTPSTASRLVERAAEAGMVARHRSTDDSRRVIIALTDAGQALAARARAHRRARLADVLTPWPTERIERFAQDLHDFAQATLTPQEGAR